VSWHVDVGDHEIVITRAAGPPGAGDPAVRHLLPLGVVTLVGGLSADPPRPEELTNAIGAVADHLDDLVRERPDVIGATVSMSGPDVTAVVAVEVGAPALLPFALDRLAAEDVFRTVATEPRDDRARNPGLDPLLVDRIVAGCCIVVGVMRKLQIDAVTVTP
jgi:exopolyphosphatase/guanosine-5'-triphosphate,3'-diphosphate pyrophosphatase